MSLRTLSQILVTLGLLGLSIGSGAGQAPSATSPFKGEYFVTSGSDAVCVPYTRNLNQFRRLDFDVCHPRLSDKYPQFTRPAWEEILLDLDLAKQVIDNRIRDPEKREKLWQAWLKASEPLRAEGKLKLWRLRIDIDHDGGPETLIRLDNPLTITGPPGEENWAVRPDACPYRDGMLYMLESSFEPPARRLRADPEGMKKGFNLRAYEVTDILHFWGGPVYHGQGHSYYGIDQRFTLPSLDGRNIGATRGMKVYGLSHWGASQTCTIDWVPTGRYRPLTPSHPTR